MTIELVEYSAFLTLPDLDAQAVRQIEQAAQEVPGGLAVSVGPRFLEFDYSGRDRERKIVTYLSRIAPLVGTADGEVECVLTTDTGETCFEFYTIRYSRLYCQAAKLVRQPPVEVCGEGIL